MTETDGTFLIDVVNQLIHVFSQKFSTYAIGYTTEPEPVPTLLLTLSLPRRFIPAPAFVTSAAVVKMWLAPRTAVRISACC